MQVTWDYTQLAQAYLARPDYSDDVVRACLAIASVEQGDEVCDVGAGVGHLTLMLLARGLRVVAVEPNEAMRSTGQQQTLDSSSINWVTGTGEETGQRKSSFRLVGDSLVVARHFSTSRANLRRGTCGTRSGSPRRLCRSDGWIGFRAINVAGARP